MPCYDSRNSRDEVEKAAKLEFQADLDKLTRLLCAACKRLEEADFPFEEWETELATWWREHQKVDRQRGENEKSDESKYPSKSVQRRIDFQRKHSKRTT